MQEAKDFYSIGTKRKCLYMYDKKKDVCKENNFSKFIRKIYIYFKFFSLFFKILSHYVIKLYYFDNLNNVIIS